MGGGSLSDSMNTQTSLKWYYGVSAFAQLPGIIGLILIGVLFGHYRGGFSWGVSSFFYDSQNKNNEQKNNISILILAKT